MENIEGLASEMLFIRSDPTAITDEDDEFARDYVAELRSLGVLREVQIEWDVASEAA